MSEAILSALWIGTTLFFVFREIKAKEERKSHNYWLSELRECLHSIQNEFSRRCSEIVKDNLPDTIISKLQEEYINEVYKKVVSRKGEYFAKSLPDYIVKDYERNISEIADIYHNIYYK